MERRQGSHHEGKSLLTIITLAAGRDVDDICPNILLLVVNLNNVSVISDAVRGFKTFNSEVNNFIKTGIG